MTDENILTLDGNSYKEKDLDNQQKYFKNQIQDLQAKSTRLRFQLDQVINSTGSSLSLGVRRRLALARALIIQGKIAILDEPTEGIDAKGAESVYKVMSDLSAAGITLIICSHDSAVLNGAHHVLDLDAGSQSMMRTVSY